MLTSLNIPASVIEAIGDLPQSIAAMMYLTVMNYAYKGIIPEAFETAEEQQVFDRCRKILDPIVERRKKSMERAEQRRLEKKQDPEGYAARLRERKLKAISRIDLKFLNTKTVVVLAHALIRDKRLCHDFLFAELQDRQTEFHRKRGNTDYDPMVDLIHDESGEYEFVYLSDYIARRDQCTG